MDASTSAFESTSNDPVTSTFGANVNGASRGRGPRRGGVRPKPAAMMSTGHSRTKSTNAHRSHFYSVSYPVFSLVSRRLSPRRHSIATATSTSYVSMDPTLSLENYHFVVIPILCVSFPFTSYVFIFTLSFGSFFFLSDTYLARIITKTPIHPLCATAP